jgi:small subunit ribosomal protein S16
MIKIRLSRGGARNAPIYKVVAVDERKKRDGAPLDIIGIWDPKKDTKSIDKKKYENWVNKGAVTTKAVEKLL